MSAARGEWDALDRAVLTTYPTLGDALDAGFNLAPIIILVTEAFLTTKEVASLLKLSEARVRQLANAQQLKSHKRGRDHLFLRSEVEAFLGRPKAKPGRPPKNI